MKKRAEVTNRELKGAEKDQEFHKTLKYKKRSDDYLQNLRAKYGLVPSKGNFEPADTGSIEDIRRKHELKFIEMEENGNRCKDLLRNCLRDIREARKIINVVIATFPEEGEEMYNRWDFCRNKVLEAETALKTAIKFGRKVEVEGAFQTFEDKYRSISILLEYAKRSEREIRQGLALEAFSER